MEILSLSDPIGTDPPDHTRNRSEKTVRRFFLNFWKSQTLVGLPFFLSVSGLTKVEAFFLTFYSIFLVVSSVINLGVPSQFFSILRVFRMKDINYNLENYLR